MTPPNLSLRWAVRTAVAALAAAVTVTPILATPYGGDDLVNRNTWPNLGNYGSALSFALDATQQWIQTQGRFFPGSFVLMATVWDQLDSRPAYKLFLVATALLAVLLFAFVLWRLTRDFDVVLLGTMALVPGFQLRYWLDPWAQFHGLIPVTLILLLGAFLLADRFVASGGWGWMVASGGALLLAGVTYETALLAVPSLGLLLALRGPRLRATRIALASFAGVTVALILLALGLRVGKVPDPAYQLGWGENTPSVFRDQFLGALPVSQYWAGSAPGAGLFVSLLPVAMMFFGIPLTAALFPSARSERALSWRKPLVMMGAGLLLAILPAVLVGLTRKFQVADLQGAYISVGYQVVGIGLVVAGFAWGILRCSDLGRYRLVRLMLAVAVASVVSLTIAANAQFASTQVPGDVYPKPAAECIGLPYAC